MITFSDRPIRTWKKVDSQVVETTKACYKERPVFENKLVVRKGNDHD